MRSYPDLRLAWSEGGIGWIPFYLDRCDRHYTNQRWLNRDFGGRLPSEVFREHSLACYVTDPTSLKLRHEIGIDTIAWQNACRFFNWDPFAGVPRQQATVGALRAAATDVDTSIRSRKEWARLYAEHQRV